MNLTNNNNLTKHLVDIGVLKSKNIIDAFYAIDRADFVKEDLKEFAYIDEALPIGFYQTISQPYTVAFMMELLQPDFSDNVLEIGFGSGWQTTILAHIVSNYTGRANTIKHIGLTSVVGADTKKQGKIYSFEIILELCDFGKRNIEKYDFVKNEIVKIFCKNALNGLPEIAEKIGGFDKIIAAAEIHGDFNTESRIPIGNATSTPKQFIINVVPVEWKKQLKIGGKMVLPINQSVWLFIKKSEENFETIEYPGFVFVPFVE